MLNLLSYHHPFIHFQTIKVPLRQKTNSNKEAEQKQTPPSHPQNLYKDNGKKERKRKRKRKNKNRKPITLKRDPQNGNVTVTIMANKRMGNIAVFGSISGDVDDAT